MIEAIELAVLGSTDSTNTVLTRINASLSGSGMSFSTLTAANSDPGSSGAYILPSDWASASGGTAITVTLRMPYSQVSWLPTPYFLKTANVTASATLSSERP